jgi:uncharacterized membrane protein YjjP (DUF1212 family)
MQKESVWIILYVIIAIGAFLSFLIYGNFLDLAIILLFLPIFFILIFRIKKISFNLLLRSLVGVIIIQILAILYIYLNLSSYLKTTIDYLYFYGILGFIILTTVSLVDMYRRRDQITDNHR